MKLLLYFLLALPILAGDIFQTISANQIEAKVSSYRTDEIGMPTQYGVNVCVTTSDEKVIAFRVYVMVRTEDGYSQEQDSIAAITANRSVCRQFPTGTSAPSKVRELTVYRIYGEQAAERLISSESR